MDAQPKLIPCGWPSPEHASGSPEEQAASAVSSPLARPSQHFTQQRSKLVWSWLPVGEVARWKIDPLRGAAPELRPKLHLSPRPG